MRPFGGYRGALLLASGGGRRVGRDADDDHDPECCEPHQRRVACSFPCRPGEDEGCAAWGRGGRRRSAGASGVFAPFGGSRSRVRRSLAGRLRRWLGPIAEAMRVPVRRFARRWPALSCGRDEERDWLVGREFRACGRDLGEDLAGSRASGHFQVVADGTQPLRENSGAGGGTFDPDDVRRRETQPERVCGRVGSGVVTLARAVSDRGCGGGIVVTRWGFAHTP